VPDTPPEPAAPEGPLELLPGTADLLVLRTLFRVLDPAPGV
jgi:hypothetical protein